MDFANKDPSKMSVTDLIDEVKSLRECVASFEQKVLGPNACCVAKDKQMQELHRALSKSTYAYFSMEFDMKEAKFQERWAKEQEQKAKEKLAMRMCDACRREKIDDKFIKQTILALEEDLKKLKREHGKVMKELNEIKWRMEHDKQK